jgi:flagellar basal-body rod protein FlgB
MANVVNPAFTNIIFNQLKALSARHEVISGNITNSTTPGYKALDVRLASNFKELLNSNTASARKKLPLTLTTSSHISSSGVLYGNFSTIMQQDVEEKPNGNNVSLPGETLRLVQNNQKYEEVSSIYNFSTNLIKSVIGKDGA